MVSFCALKIWKVRFTQIYSHPLYCVLRLSDVLRLSEADCSQCSAHLKLLALKKAVTLENMFSIVYSHTRRRLYILISCYGADFMVVLDEGSI